MEGFRTITGIAAPMPRANIDTDELIPKQFLKTVKRTGLGKSLFFEARYDADGKENREFILNQEPYRRAKILIAGANFGCGSSREHAVWALADFGIRCVIAPSFADIFASNCLKNGVLCVVLAPADVDQMMARTGVPENAGIAVDLERQEIRAAEAGMIRFTIDEARRHLLLEGLDEIETTLKQTDKIAAFETLQKSAQPWLYDH